jgi:Zn-dependent protease with chaperone function
VSESAHLYFDGETAAPKSVAVRTDLEGIGIVDADGQSLAKWRRETIRVVGENAINKTLTLRLEPDRGARLQVASGEDRDAIFERLNLRHWRRQARLLLLKGFALWGGLALAACASFYLIWGPASIAIAEHMPESWEARLGDRVQGIFVRESKICKNSGGQQALEKLVEGLRPPKLEGVPIQIIVVRSDIANAFAIPGRRIVIFSELISVAKDPEMLAGVLAHEMAHAELRHPVRALVHQLGSGAVFGLVFGDSTIAGIGQIALALSYTRDIEREADVRAIEILKASGMRADGLSRFLDLIANSPDFKPMLPDFMRTHPDFSERIAATRQPAIGKLAMSQQEWTAVRAMCPPAN